MTVVMSDDRRCHATNRQGERCKQWAIRGGRVCRYHGGSLRKTKQAAARRLAEAKAARSLAEQGVAPLGEPLEAFRDIAAEAVAFKEYAAALVAELEGALTGLDRQGREDVRAKVALYERGLDRAGKFLAEYARLNIDERLARLDERRGALVEAVIVRILTGVGVDPALPAVREVVFAELSAAVEPARVIEVSS